jgi:hypothetical protein
MDAQELQRLKELAQAATPGPWDYIGKSYTDNGTYYFEVMDSVRNNEVVGEYGPCEEDAKFIAAANPAAVLELIALAERAVSPAESVQSVDFYNKKLLEILWRWAETHMKRGYTNDNQAEAHASLVDFLNAAVTAQEKIAHAEGRRSAMEELAKEKERADKETKRLNWIIRRALLCTNPWAEQQGRRARFDAVAHSDFGTDKRYYDDMRAAIDTDIAADDWGGHQSSSTAQPLQQEGGKETDTDAAKRMRLIATKLGLGSAIPESDEELWGCAFSVLGMIRRKVEELLAQPSDNLQQASTVQVAPAKMKCPTCGVDRFKKPCPNMADECPMVADAHLLKPAASVTKVEPVAWAVYAPNGNVRIWFGEVEAAKRWAKYESAELVPLYRAAPPQQVDTGGLPG